MNSNPLAARQAFQNAQVALQRGDKQTARRWAEQAAVLAPQWEEPWLILAAIASPRASVAYLERALKINPLSERALRGMVWAVERVKKESPEPVPQSARLEDTKPCRAVKLAPQPITSLPHPTQPDPTPTMSAPALPAAIKPGNTTRRRFPVWPLLALIVCVAVGWAFWPGTVSPVLALPGLPILPGQPIRPHLTRLPFQQNPTQVMCIG
jgi:hypothetical protein